jgi:SH3 domain protein
MRSAAPALVLAAASLLYPVSRVSAETAYVSDQLVLNVYTEQNQQGQRLATLHSGARVETLAASGDFTQVRLPDGTTGWVKSAYLTTDEPATVRLKQLQDELDRSRATTPALAEAAAKSDLERRERDLADLKARLEERQARLDAALAARAPVAGAAPPRPLGAGLWLGVGLGAGALGFWGGYATLARRVRRKFGGLKVY